jgi:hypothetical protein
MRLVLVEWMDSYAARGWKTKADLDAAMNNRVTCRSIGWIFGRTKDYLMVVPHLSFTRQGVEHGSGDLCIPHRSILKIKTIKL